MSELNKLLDKPSDVEAELEANELRISVLFCTLLVGVIAGLSSC